MQTRLLLFCCSDCACNDLESSDETQSHERVHVNSSSLPRCQLGTLFRNLIPSTMLPLLRRRGNGGGELAVAALAKMVVSNINTGMQSVQGHEKRTAESLEREFHGKWFCHAPLPGRPCSATQNLYQKKCKIKKQSEGKFVWAAR